jgi:hypothetical protein
VRNNQCNMHEVKGILEVQRQILLKLGQKENRELAEEQNPVGSISQSDKGSSRSQQIIKT